ncbi:MAG: GNAT family N-acetyltransferase [Spirochaetales bacterium]|nr:GNAT family N-acetyltransferase [Spirochaetales bacterium]
MPKLLTGIASPPDVPAILSFWQKSQNASFSTAAAGMGLKDYVSKNPFMCLVAEQSGKICATVVYGIKEHRGFIHHIALDPDYIGSGVLESLVDEAFSALRKRSCTRCHIFVHDMASNAVTKEIIEKIEWARAAGSQIYTHDLEYPLHTDEISTD